MLVTTNNMSINEKSIGLFIMYFVLQVFYTNTLWCICINIVGEIFLLIAKMRQLDHVYILVFILILLIFFLNFEVV